MQTITNITLDVAKPYYPPVVYAKQGDSDTRFISISIQNGGIPWEPPDGVTGIVGIEKPDGTTCFYENDETGASAVSFSGNVATLTLVTQALAAAGEGFGDLSLYDANKKKLSTFPFRLVIEKAAAPDETITSSNYYSILTQEIAAAIAAAEQVTSLAGFRILGYYDTEEELAQSVPNPQPGDAYGVGTSNPHDIYVWDGVSQSWKNTGPMKGERGPAGAAAGFGVPEAKAYTVPENEEAKLEVAARGEDTEKIFTFRLGVPRGEKGEPGADGVGIQSVRQTTTSTESGGENIVTVTKTDGSTETFSIYNGEQGAPGQDGKDGEDGKGLTILGYYNTLNELQSDIISPEAGDAYGVGSVYPYEVYIWDGVGLSWKNNGTIQGPQGLQGKDGQDGQPGKDGQPGADGVGIQSVRQTTTSTESGGENIVTVTKTDGSTETFSIYNGEQGAPGQDGQPGENGKPGQDGQPGADGKAATIKIGTVTEGDEPDVKNSGTDTDAILDFVLPTGGSGGGTSVIEVTCMAAGDTVTATDGAETVSGTAGENAACSLEVPYAGTWKTYVNGYYWGKTEVYGYGRYMRPIPRFGFSIAASNSAPATRVSYLYDAEGLTPVGMNFTDGIFDYGDWGDFLAVKGNYPVMLRYDGTEDYKLNPNDYAYKEDGITPSDVSDTAYEGNAMSAFPRMWVHRYTDASGNKCCVFCPVQFDNNYRADAFVNHDGNTMEKFYMPCFKGALVDGKLRSMMGLAPQSNSTATQEVGYAAANNPEGKALWTIIPWSRRAYINDLLVLLGRHTETQVVYGQGSVTHSTAASGFCQTGTLAAMGQFFGYSTTKTKTQVKVLHMEGVWGDRWDRIVGLVNNNGKIAVKMAPPYSLDTFDDYTLAGITPGGTSGGYISATVMSELGNIPKTASGSATTYEADGLWFVNNVVAIPLVGCSCHSGSAAALSGAFALNVTSAASHAAWNVGASPSCDQPSAA